MSSIFVLAIAASITSPIFPNQSSNTSNISRDNYIINRKVSNNVLSSIDSTYPLNMNKDLFNPYTSIMEITREIEIEEKLIQLLNSDDFENYNFASESFINDIQNNTSNYLLIINNLSKNYNLFRKLISSYIFSSINTNNTILDRIISKCFESNDIYLQDDGITLLEINKNDELINKFANSVLSNNYLNNKFKKLY